MLHGEYFVPLLFGTAGQVLQGFAFAEQYLQRVAFSNLRQLQLGAYKGHGAMFLGDVDCMFHELKVENEVLGFI